MDNCPIDIADEVIVSLGGSQINFDNRKEAVMYFGRYESNIEELLASITNQTSTRTESSKQLPIAYPDPINNNVVHYDFTSFVEVYNNQPLPVFLQTELVNAMALKMITSIYDRITAIIVLPYDIIPKDEETILIHCWERVSQVFGHQSKYNLNINIIVNDIPKGTIKKGAHTSLINMLTNIRQKSRMPLYQNDYAFQKTTDGIIKTFIENNSKYSVQAIYYNYKEISPLLELRQFVFRQLLKKGISPKDFAILQSQKTKDYLSCIRKNVITSVCQDYQTLIKKMQDFIQNDISKNDDQLDKLGKRVSMWSTRVKDISILWDLVDNGKGAFASLLNKIKILCNDHELTEQFLKGSLQKRILIQFVDLLAGAPKNPRKAGTCVENSNEITNYMKSWSSWVQFLQQVDMSLLKRQRIDVQMVRYLEKLKTVNLNDVTKQNYRNLMLILQQECCEPMDFQNKYVDQLKMNILFALVNERLSKRNQYKCENGKLSITGDIIDVSFIDVILDQNPACKSSLKEIEMYAVTHIEFKDGLYERGINQLTIFAPTWQILESIFIDIQGNSPPNQKNKTAMHGTVAGGDGSDGLAGQHGGHGAHFFGIARNFENVGGNSLSINTSGGKGTSGQNGGNGSPGRQSSRITYFIHEIKTILSINYHYFVHFDHNINYECKQAPVFWQEMCRVRQNETEYHALCVERTNCKTCRFAPKVVYPNREMPEQDDWWLYAQTVRLPGDQIATKGGNGGNGGVAGKGGNSGELLIADFDLNVPSGVTKSSTNGTSGVAGIGGKGGKGGKEHDKMLCYDNKEYAKMKGSWLTDGSNGADDVALSGWKDKPVQANFNPVPYIEKFKYELRNNVNVPFQVVKSIHVIEKLENSQLIDKYYSLGDYITAFTNLEKQFYEPTYDTNVLRCYDLLYQKLSNIKPESKNSEVLPFLKAALFTKIITMKKLKFDNLIMDFVNHFKILIESVIEHKTINEIVIINQDKLALIGTLQEKIREAENLVRSQVTIAIDGNVKEIESEIKDFLTQIEETRKQAQDDNMKLQTLEKQLEKTVTLNLVMNIFKSISSLLSLLGPVGAVVGAVSGSLTDVASTFLQEDTPLELSLPMASAKLVNDLTTASYDLSEHKSKLIQEELDELKLKISSDIDAKDLVKEIQNLDEKLFDEKRKRNKDVSRVKDIQNAQVELIARKEKDLEQRNSKNEKLKNVLEHFGTVITIAETSMSIYESYKEDNDALSTIRQQIKDSDENIQKIQETKNEVEKSVGSLLNTLKNDMINVEQQLKEQSKASLDVKRWDIQSRLVDLKMQLRKLTNVIEDKTIRDNILGYINKLEMTMNTMINIYDRIDSFKDQMELIEYIGAVNMAKSQLIYIPDPQIRHQAEELLVTIRTNTIMWQYNIFAEQLKQATFPNAKEYLRTINSLINPDIKSFDRNKIIALYTNKIIEVNNKLQTLDFEVGKEAKDLMFVSFSSDYVSSKPFFTWKRSEHRLSINRILRGEAITLFADITQSELPYNAVKFNTVQLQFKVKSTQKTQEALDAVLKKFTIRLTHSGESYYRCNSDYYKIKTEPQMISYTYENNVEDDEPVYFNHVYKFLRDGSHMLSPYSYWKIQLTAENETDFNALREFRDIIQLELAGTGHHFQNKLICTNLEGHYDAYKIVDDESISMFRMNNLLQLNLKDDAENIIEKYMALKLPYGTYHKSKRSTRSVTFTPPPKENLLRTMWKRSVDFISNLGQNSLEHILPNASSSATAAQTIQNYDFNSTLLLADVICRKLTKQKHSYCPMDQNTSADEQAAAIILTDTIENIITYFHPDDQGEVIFDPITTQSTLLRLMRRQTPPAQINEYILSTIKQDIPTGCAVKVDEILAENNLY